jgi:ABC-type uncharacterized transport system permease subunit
VADMTAIKLSFSYLRIGILNEFQYRVNLYIQILQSFIALITGLIGLNLVFSQTSDLGGWSKAELHSHGCIHSYGGVIRLRSNPTRNGLWMIFVMGP